MLYEANNFLLPKQNQFTQINKIMSLEISSNMMSRFIIILNCFALVI